jgi:hypothetical protein
MYFLIRRLSRFLKTRKQQCDSWRGPSAPGHEPQRTLRIRQTPSEAAMATTAVAPNRAG